MIEFRDRLFCCDECQMCEDIQRRLENAEHYGYEPQLDYCWCDKIGYKFWLGGYCEDAFQKIETPHNYSGKRKGGRAYRRDMKVRKQKSTMKIMTYGYKPYAGYTDWGIKDGVYQPVGQYIQYPKNSNLQKFWKKYSNRRIRRCKEAIHKGNSYRKHFDYSWEIY